MFHLGGGHNVMNLRLKTKQQTLFIHMHKKLNAFHRTMKYCLNICSINTT